MEHFKSAPYNQNKENNNNKNFDSHNAFFSKEGAVKFFGRTLSIAGTVMALAGIYEFTTGNKIAHLTEGFNHQIPTILNDLLDNIDKTPLILKTGLGSSMMSSGRWLRGLHKKKEK